ncbi:hypothetical protein DRN69_00300 [Candidatus Pacearchaeota archaeon]|nr:MAG: hypothetical protein DRN69_00300 [Candidatus Pacearchaeota archaeon]
MVEKRILSHDEAVAQNVLKLTELTEEELKMLSDLEEEEVGYLTILFTISDELGLEFLKSFADDFLRLRVSKGRLGRKEIVWISSSLQYLIGGGKGLKLKDIISGIG